MQTEVPPVEPPVVGTFHSSVDAERALGALRDIGLPSDRISLVMGEANAPLADGSVQAGSSGTNVAGGAATGATIGAIVGILWGWISSSAPMEVPGTVASVSSGILSATITGLLIGAAVGALIGALIGVGMPELQPSPEEVAPGDSRILLTVLAPGDQAQQAREILAAHGASDLTPRHDNQDPMAGLETQHQKELSTMADQPTGHDPDTLTGTKDDIEPGTGALGTGGTPMTTGYGESGSTSGTGSSQGRAEQESGDFSGSTPQTYDYERGGRASGDSADRGSDGSLDDESSGNEQTARHSDRAPVQSDPRTRDIYERGPSYDAPVTTTAADTDATDFYSPADVDAPPTYGNVDMDSAQESAGTNIPGTADPRGLGDNTDDR